MCLRQISDRKKGDFCLKPPFSHLFVSNAPYPGLVRTEHDQPIFPSEFREALFVVRVLLYVGCRLGNSDSNNIASSPLPFALLKFDKDPGHIYHLSSITSTCLMWSNTLQICLIPYACMIPYNPYTSSTTYIPYTPYIPYTLLSSFSRDCYIDIHDSL